MKFDYEKYGFLTRNMFKGNKEAEPHCSLVFSLNNMEKINEEQFQITNGLPVEQNIELLKELREGCNIRIKELSKLQKDWESKNKVV